MRRFWIYVCIVMFVCGSLGFQVGLYIWHAPVAFPRPVEKQRETFVERAPPKKMLRTNPSFSSCLLPESTCDKITIGGKFGVGMGGNGGLTKRVLKGVLNGQEIILKYPRQDGPDQHNGQKTWPSFKLFKECELMKSMRAQYNRGIRCFGICFSKDSNEDNWKRHAFIVTEKMQSGMGPKNNPLSQAKYFVMMADLIQRFGSFKPGAIEYRDAHSWHQFAVKNNTMSSVDMDDVFLWFGDEREKSMSKTVNTVMKLFNKKSLQQCGGVFQKWYKTFIQGEYRKSLPRVTDNLCREPLLEKRVKEYALPSTSCAKKCLTHLRAYYNHYHGKDVVFERAEGCNIVFREGVDVLRMDINKYEKINQAVDRIDGNMAVCSSLPPLFRRLTPNQIFVRTGDIHDMWIRDSAAQVWPYRNDTNLVNDVLNMQRFFIEHDPYANSYHDHEVLTPSNADKHLGRTGWVATRNYELDSGCYFIRLLYHAWKYHRAPLEIYRNAVRKLIDVWKTEQYHEEKSPYRYPELPRNGLGSPVGYTGMTWSGFRPSDDACKYGYHIPSNLFAVESLSHVMKMYPAMGDVSTLRDDILQGVEKYGTWQDGDVRRYCYEVDGLGNCNKMDDANVPSLLSIPYLNTVYDQHTWRNTYEWVWSPKNPYFFEGKAAEGIGSPHTPKDYIWPMSIIMRGLVDVSQCEAMKRKVNQTMIRGSIHESFHKDHASKLTREDFAWPNALFSEMICL